MEHNSLEISDNKEKNNSPKNELDHSQSNLRNRIESNFFERFILTVIVLNAITLGIESTPNLSRELFNIIRILDNIFLGIFVIELTLKFYVYRLEFFKSPWRTFDFFVVAISLLPSSGPFTVIRTLRVLRALRLISAVPSLRKVVKGLLGSIPGLGSVATILLLTFYVGSVMATGLFGQAFPEWFGSVWASAYTLFQVMTLESWSMGIVRPIMETFPYAWIFFVPFILITSFTMLNLFIAVICNAMQSETEAAAEQRALEGHNEREVLLQELSELRSQIERLSNHLIDKDKQPTSQVSPPKAGDS